MINCQELTEMVTDYVEDRMNPEVRLDFEKHVSLCRHCRAYLDQMQTTTELVGKMPDEPVPEKVMSEMLGLFRDANK